MLGFKNVRSVAIGALLLSGSFIASAQAETFNWLLSGPASGPGGLVLGSGSFTANGGPTNWTVTNVSGSISDADIPGVFTITGPTSSYAGASNILYVPAQTTSGESTASFVDYGGISFGTSGPDFNIGLQFNSGGPAIYVLNS